MQDVVEGEDGSPEKKPHVAADLPEQAGEVAHEVLVLVADPELLEPERKARSLVVSLLVFSSSYQRYATVSSGLALPISAAPPCRVK